MQAVLERCIEDEIETLAILPNNVEIDLLTDAIYEAFQHFIFENCIVERIDIIVDNPDIKVKVCNDQEMAQSERNSHSDCKNQSGSLTL